MDNPSTSSWRRYLTADDWAEIVSICKDLVEDGLISIDTMEDTDTQHEQWEETNQWEMQYQYRIDHLAKKLAACMFPDETDEKAIFYNWYEISVEIKNEEVWPSARKDIDE